MTSTPPCPAVEAATGSSARGWADAGQGPGLRVRVLRGAEGYMQFPPQPTQLPPPNFASRRGARRRGPGRLATGQEVPRAALSMLSRSVCAPRVWALRPAASRNAPAGQQSRWAVSEGWGTLRSRRTPQPRPSSQHPPTASLLSRAPRPAFLLPPKGPSTLRVLRPQVPRTSTPSPTQAQPASNVTPNRFLRSLRTHLPALAALIQPAQPEPPL